MAYRFEEILRVVDAGPADDETWYRLQVSGKATSQHMNVTATELEVIAALLTKGDYKP